MKDYIVRATAAEGSIRAFAARTTNMAAKAQRIHNLFPVASAALGRVMTAAAMMSVDMKGERNTLSVIVKGGGPLGSIVTVASANGSLKGYVDNPEVELPLNSIGKLDVGGAVGHQGKLTVIKDLGLKEPYIGQIQLVSGEIGEDIAQYFWISEQQPSVVGLGTLVNPDLSVKAAGGYILQPLPGAKEHIIADIEAQLMKLPPISTLIDQGETPEAVLSLVLGAYDLKVHATVDTEFACDCNRERLKGVVLTLGKDEIENILQTDGQAELVCHYCNEKYMFYGEELELLLKKARQTVEN